MVSLRIILVQPRNPLNILAAARAARNFGMGDIAVVDVQQPAWEEALHKDVDRETPHGPRATSRGWLGDARKFDTLAEAIAECDWVLGTSSLERRKVSRGEVIDLPALPARLAAECGISLNPTPDAPHPYLHTQHPAASPQPTPDTRQPEFARHRVAILFGSEKRGLANEHLVYCHQVLRIPTVEGLPSMNLGQAVAVVCYELARSGVLAGRQGGGGDSREAESVKADFSIGSAGGAAAANTTNAGASLLSVSKRNAGKSADANFSGESVKSAGSKSAGKAGLAVSAAASESTESSELTEKSKEFSGLATVGEKQALADYITALARGQRAEPAGVGLESEDEDNYRKLIKMLSRLPLTGQDVRRIFKLIKDARTANS